ncbi:aminoglycoside phosphotransferase family protein [Persicobacter psychrovividus]|uniref:Aminoglycoside phosphotransferase domain-containing protein n=1 Tax=Persicobacter psychrovividus TaxID=387638 RepID=A0ABN6LKQ8_9BACT|nr:hypothetical protein PEPS_44540 [Persicobacter psychrovividus]
MSENKLICIADQFNIGHKAVEIIPFGSGHINDTYKVTCTNKSEFILQRINHQIFTDVDGLMSNIEKVTHHIRSKISTDVDRATLTVIPTKNNELYYYQQNLGYWRLYKMIKDAKTYEQTETAEQAFQCGMGFGEFHRQLADFPPHELSETIKGFHCLENRLQQFEHALKHAEVGRLAMAKPEIEFINGRIAQMRDFVALELPKRITHNDTKLNNIMFDQQDNILCVIDLDTVMPGLVAYDFGDAIRTIGNTGAEDEKDLSKIQFNLTSYHAFAEGYVNKMGATLTPLELESLPFSCRYITYIIGLRFLTDFLSNDVYFKTKYAEHNLVRCRTQLKLISEMEAVFDQMNISLNSKICR